MNPPAMPHPPTAAASPAVNAIDIASRLYSPEPPPSPSPRLMPHPQPAASASASTSPPPAPEAYYDGGRGCFWIRKAQGGWVTLNETGVKRFFRAQGVSTNIADGDYVSPLDALVLDVQTNRDISYAGPLSGCQAGVHAMGGRLVLVTDAPRLIGPQPGEWPNLVRLLAGLFDSGAGDQTPYLFGWLKVALQSLRAGSRRPGQALAIAGPSNCGKSLLQKLITELLGGRMAKPYQFMTGQTPFNAHCFTAEHLVIEDEAASSDIRMRRAFGAHLKEVTANEHQSCHAKNRQPVTLSPFWRLSITVNDEPENLMVLPPIDDSLEDKVMLLRARRSAMPMPTDTDEERRAFWAALLGELPAFVAWLDAWEIPAELRSARYGVRHFHHPELLRAIDDLSPERRLLDLIDAELFAVPGAGPWEGKAEQLEKRLTGPESRSAYEARRVLSFNTACGVYLSRLAKKHPGRIARRIHHGCNLWTVAPTAPGGG